MNVTPMMRQYLEIKEQHQDCIIFFRLGDFYEMFFEDALTASKELEITLTGRDCGLAERAPMCGVPVHAVENYLVRLVEKGYKVAICEQVEEVGASKGIVKRDVVRIVTPGTLLESSHLQADQNNYLATVVASSDTYGLSIADISTGEWQVTTIPVTSSPKKLLDELSKYHPSECLLGDNLTHLDEIRHFLKESLSATVQLLPSHYLDLELSQILLCEHFNVLSLESIGLGSHAIMTLASASLLRYLKDTQKNQLSHMKTLHIYTLNASMFLDMSTRRNLELTETLREKKRKGSLLWVLDHTQTAMGARFLRHAIERPLIDAEKIQCRLKATQELIDNPMMLSDLTEALAKIYDLERLVSKIAYGTCNAKDLIALKSSLQFIPAIKETLSFATSPKLSRYYQALDTLDDVYELIDRAISDEPPILLREGGIIKENFSPDVDKLRYAKKEGTNWLRDLELKEREKTGIKTLKIKYNKIFGYFLEVTNSYKHLAPDYFMRKQTLSNCERYITEELKTIEDQVLGADEKLSALEYQLFMEVKESIALHLDRLLATSTILAKIDMFCSFADVAYKNNYVCPTIDEGSIIHIIEGRHPVVEKINGQHTFIANDVYLDQAKNQVNLLTGPNMAGKSTFMRQVALIVLMAQIGSFVPAQEAQIGIVDRIFTRVGASDDLASGQSTFMIEMMEVSNILHHATSKSLLVLDEIGRGTSTIDGLSIAWAIIEYIAKSGGLGAKTLFATHYHELTSLCDSLSHITNYCVAVKEMGEDIVFLHKIVPGCADHSYGIQVAKLAGLPQDLLTRSKEIMTHLSTEENQHEFSQKTDMQPYAKEEAMQLEFFTPPPSPVLETLKKLNIMELTPIEALNTLYDLQKKLS